MRLNHLNITVADLDRATEFYRRWFGFGRVLAEYEDGTRFITDDTGFELGLHPSSEPTSGSSAWHFGFSAPSPEAVRELLSSLQGSAVPVVEQTDEPGFAGFKCRDPDGHLIEVYWEPRPDGSVGQ